jgi:hypothetical protein
MKLNLEQFADAFQGLAHQIVETRAILHAELEHRRRCVAVRKDGQRCRAWALWKSQEQHCSAHTYHTRRRDGEITEELRREQARDHSPICNCAAYNWPHRAGGGLCSFPDEPSKTCPTAAGKRAPGKLRRRQIRRILHKHGV